MARRPVGLILDANCLLNVYATEHFREIAVSLHDQVGVADFVLQEETLFIRCETPTDDHDEQEPVDLIPFVSEGLVEVMYLESPHEKATYGDLSALVDDGEAVTAALALHRVPSQPTTTRPDVSLLNGFRQSRSSPHLTW